ncbi:MAG: hypothetical protein KGI19_07740 [Thaumarchaeota archaeon]|nr:hypothetical protein [Nitrososphaerota archaeon]
MVNLQKPTIVNVVSTANLNQFINIKKFVKFPWGIYDDAIYGGICGYVKSPEMHGKVTIFSSGKMISVGGKSIPDSIDQLNMAKFYMLKGGIISDVKLNCKVQNIVAVLNLNISLNLQKIYKKMKNVTYNPDNFVGIILKIPNRPTCLIFSSGKVVIAGSKTEEQLFEISSSVQQLLKKAMSK